MGQPWKERWSLQQRDAGLGAGFVRGLIPDAGLDLADVGLAQQQHAHPADDWDLNGDLLFWNEPLQCSYELSSMGIRVSPESMDRQLTMAL